MQSYEKFIFFIGAKAETHTVECVCNTDIFLGVPSNICDEQLCF